MSGLRVAALFLMATTSTVLAHENATHKEVNEEMTCISSNGAPNHEMGRFPNRANPNAFRLQDLTFCFPKPPLITDTVTRGLMTVGVSVTGLPNPP